MYTKYKFYKSANQVQYIRNDNLHTFKSKVAAAIGTLLVYLSQLNEAMNNVPTTLTLLQLLQEYKCSRVSTCILPFNAI